MARLLKGVFVVFSALGVGVIGLLIWASQQMESYQALTPAQRADADRQSAARAGADRRERLKGTDCEKLDALSCYDMRRKRKNLEAAARAWENSDMKKAYDDAGVR